jgi:sulfoxide reductase heme-binding subunit YedZ
MSAGLARDLSHLLGWLAAVALAASLAVSPAARWASRERRTRLVPMRRRLGLAGLALATAHALVVVPAALAPPHLGDLLPMIEALPYVRHGALALALLVPLGVTSFPALNARLGLRAWSTLHRAVYAASVLVALHVVAGPEVDPRAALVLCAATGALLLARALGAALLRARAFGAARGLGRRGEDEPQSALTTESPDNP